MHDDLGKNCQHHWEPASQLIFSSIDKDIIIKNCQQIKDKIVSEMSDLTKELPVEKLTEESWTADKTKEGLILHPGMLPIWTRSLFLDRWANGDLKKNIHNLSVTNAAVGVTSQITFFTFKINMYSKDFGSS